MNDEGKVAWDVKDLAPAAHTTISFELTGDMADVFSPDDVYISGINPVIVMGADPLPGDWGIKGIEVTEIDSEEEPVEEEEEEEETQEVLEDD